MKRNIIKIDEEKCNGCGLCVGACHEGALKLVDGKARLVSESYCDGLGNCLPQCPTGAITIEEREADAFDEQAVQQHMQAAAAKAPAFSCPSTRMKAFDRRPEPAAPEAERASELAQWPCQIKLVPVNAPFFVNAKLLIAADCTAYAYADTHTRFMRGRVTLIGCPKLDMADYAEKLAEIFRRNNIKSVEVLRMSVPCCGGLENAVKQALMASGKMIPWHVTVISTDGQIIEE
jgi:ferredoxin